MGWGVVLHCDRAKNTNQTKNEEVQGERTILNLARIRSQSKKRGEKITYTNITEQITIFRSQPSCPSDRGRLTVQQRSALISNT